MLPMAMRPTTALVAHMAGGVASIRTRRGVSCIANPWSKRRAARWWAGLDGQV